MKRFFKILLSFFAILLLGAIILQFPVPVQSSREIDDSVLLEYYENANWGRITTIKVFNNGTVELSTSIPKEYSRQTLSNQKLNELVMFIDSRTYSRETEMLSNKFFGSRLNCFDCGSVSYLINRNGETILISPDELVLDIIQSIHEDAPKID